jgi:cell division protein FtsB
MAALAGGVAGGLAERRGEARRTPGTRRAETAAAERGGGFGHISRMLLVGLILMAVAFFGLMQVLQTSQVATTGFEMRVLQTERTTLEAEIRLLEASIAEQSQLERVRDEATNRLGMVEPERTLRVSVSERAPVAVPLPRRYVEPVTETTTEAAAWWEPLLERLPGFN